MDAYNPGEHGYSPLRAKMYGEHGWIVTDKDKPTLVMEKGTGWYCVLPSIYDSEWMPVARAMLG